MRINRALPIAILSLLLAAGPFLYMSDSFTFHRLSQSLLSTENESGEGMEDDPAARLKWEIMRTADPATGRIPDDIHALELAFAKTIPTHESVFGTSLMKGPSGWVQRGPSNVGGRTRGLALDVTNSDVILAAGVSGGIWRSTDQGKDWVQTTTPGQLKTVTCLVQDKRAGKQNTWYAGTGEGYGGFIVAGDGFFKSTDSGYTWTSMQNTNKPQSNYNLHYIWDIALNPANTSNDEMYIAAYNTIYRSTNGGTNTQIVLGGGGNGFSSSTFTDVAVTSQGVMYATLSSDGPSGKTGIFRSTNGTSWTNITPASFPGTYNRIVIGIAPSNENIVYFLASTPGSGFVGVAFDGKKDYNSFWKYTYLSGSGKDSGGLWENRSSNLPNYFHHHPWIFGDFSTQGGYDMLVKVKPDDENTVFIGGTNLYRSGNGFKDTSKTSWIGGYNHAKSILQDYAYPNHHPDQHNFVFLPGNYNTAFSSCDGGIFRTDNALDTGVRWASLNNSYVVTQFYAVALNHNAKLGHAYSDIIVGGLQDNNSWLVNAGSPPSTPWQPWYRGDGGYCAVIDNDTATFLYTSLQLGRIRKDVFDKNGNNLGWARIDPAGGRNYLFETPYVLDPKNTNTMYLIAGAYLWRNDSLGQLPLLKKNDSISTGWVRLDKTYYPFSDISCVAVADTPTHRVYYGTADGHIFRVDSANGTAPASKDITSRLFHGGMYINCLAIDPKNGNKVIAVCSNYGVRSLFYTTNAGANWADISANLEEKSNGSGNGPSCRWAKIMYDPTSGDPFYFVGASTGLYMARGLKGDSTLWVQEGSTSIGNIDVEMIDGRSSDGTMIIGTYGAGVFSANFNTLIGIDNNKSIASGYYLKSLYPNPAENITYVDLFLPTFASVTVKVFDLSGKQVSGPPVQTLPGGNQQIALNLRGLSSGVYFCYIEVNGHCEVKKIMKQ